VAEEWIIEPRAWNSGETTAFLDLALEDILSEAVIDAVGVAHSAASPFLRTRVGLSTVSPAAGSLRSDIDWWLDRDVKGIYAAVGHRGNFARVAAWLGAAGGKPARQIRRAQAYLVRAVERTAGWPMRKAG
jgi:hypothetical protein